MEALKGYGESYLQRILRGLHGGVGGVLHGLEHLRHVCVQDFLRNLHGAFGESWIRAHYRIACGSSARRQACSKRRDAALRRQHAPPDVHERRRRGRHGRRATVRCYMADRRHTWPLAACDRNSPDAAPDQKARGCPPLVKTLAVCVAVMKPRIKEGCDVMPDFLHATTVISLRSIRLLIILLALASQNLSCPSPVISNKFLQCQPDILWRENDKQGREYTIYTRFMFMCSLFSAQLQ